MKTFKKIKLFTALISLTTLMAYAQTPSTATFFSEDGHRFWVIIDGERQNAEPAHRVVVPNLTKDFYRARIIFEDERFKDVSQHIQLVDVDNQRMNVVYAIRERRGAMVLRISSFEPVSASTPPPAPVNPTTEKTPTQPAVPATTTTTTTRNVTTQQQIPTTNTQTTVTSTENVNFGTSVTVDGQQVGMNINLSGIPGMTTTTTTTTSTTSSNNLTQQQEFISPNPAANASASSNSCIRAISNDQFQRGVNSIKNESFADNQMRVARQFTRNNCLSVDQIITIMGLFSFEQNKLEYAKFAYDYCVDKGNYFMVNEAFNFSSSKNELNNFLESRQ